MSFSAGLGDESAVLHGADGDLVFVRVRVESRLLEDLLEALARAAFPINPEIRHGFPFTFVEFPAYDGQVDEIRSLLESAGIEAGLDLLNMLSAIA